MFHYVKPSKFQASFQHLPINFIIRKSHQNIGKALGIRMSVIFYFHKFQTFSYFTKIQIVRSLHREYYIHSFGFMFDIGELIARFSEDELEYEAFDGTSSNGQLQITDEFSDPSSLFDSVFMSMSDTLNSINTLESSDQTPEDRPLNTTNTTPISPRDTLRYGVGDRYTLHLLVFHKVWIKR